MGQFDIMAIDVYFGEDKLINSVCKQMNTGIDDINLAEDDAGGVRANFDFFLKIIDRIEVEGILGCKQKNIIKVDYFHFQYFYFTSNFS